MCEGEQRHWDNECVADATMRVHLCVLSNTDLPCFHTEYLFKHVDLDREFPEPKNRRIRLVPPSTDAPDSSPRLSPPTRPVLKTKSKKKPRPPDRNRRLMPKDVVVKIEPPDDPNDASGDMPDEFTKYQVMDCIPNVLHYSPSSQQRRAMVFKQERDWY